MTMLRDHAAIRLLFNDQLWMITDCCSFQVSVLVIKRGTAPGTSNMGSINGIMRNGIENRGVPGVIAYKD
jgi:hypothetical protein